MNRRYGLGLAAGLCLLAAAPAFAQAKKPPAPAPKPQEIGAAELEGTWVSVVTEDWRYRMVTPGRGEYAGIPINRAARDAADGWDPAKDEAAGEQCRAYGAGALMRVPGRIRISRVDDRTIKVEMDNGMQTRLLHLGARPVAEPSWQGTSNATWNEGTLEVRTQGMRPGYLRKNGVPYSAQARLTEYWDVHKEADGGALLVITSLLEDPVYLQAPYAFSPVFRREKDGSKWDPVPCKSQ